MRRHQDNRTRRLSWGFLCLLVSATGLLSACGGFVDVDGATWSREIGEEGGAVVNGALSLEVPGGALEEPARIEIVATEDVVAGGVGLAWDLSPHDAVFVSPATLRLRLDDGALLELATSGSLRLARVAEGDLDFDGLHDASFDAEARLLSVAITRLGLFVLACDDGDPCSADSYDPVAGCVFELGACASEEDRDGDGDPDASDCAPDDNTVFHGADEACNARDDDCDGETDEAPSGADDVALCTEEHSCRDGACVPDRCEGPDALSDPGLDAAVREALRIKEGPIDWLALSRMEGLDASDRGIEDLLGLSCLQGLRTLDLSGNDIEDIAEIAYLHALESLDLSDNRITLLGALLENEGLGEGDEVSVTGNPIDCASQASVLEELLERGLSLKTDCSE